MESFYCTIVLEVSDQTAVPMEYLNTVVKVDYLNDPLSTNELKRALRYFPKCKRFLFPRVEITDAVVAELESIDTPLIGASSVAYPVIALRRFSEQVLTRRSLICSSIDAGVVYDPTA